MLCGGEVPAGKAWAGRQSSWAGANDLLLPPRPFRQSGGPVAAVYDRRKGLGRSQRAATVRGLGAGGREKMLNVRNKPISCWKKLHGPYKRKRYITLYYVHLGVYWSFIGRAVR